MKTIYIHIGSEKTGTTSIQNFLAANHNVLKRRGVYYPIDNSKKYNYYNQHASMIPSLLGEVLPSIRDEKSYPGGEAFEDFLKDLPSIKEDRVLVSSENFFGIIKSVDTLNKLKNKLSDHKVKIILYLRRQDELYISAYQQALKVGIDTPPSIEHAKREKRTHYYERLNIWAEVFGAENIIVRPFDKEHFYRNDLYADFLNVLDIDLDNSFQYPVNQNESLPLEKAQFLQKLNQYTVPLRDLENSKRWLYQDLREMIINDDDFLVQGKVKSIFSYKDRIEILKYFEEENKKISHEFLGKPNVDLFKKPDIEDKEQEGMNESLNDNDFIKNLVLLLEKLFSQLKDFDRILNMLMEYKKQEKKNEKQIIKDYHFIKGNNLVDESYYLKQNPDVLSNGVDPTWHYVRHGWLEGRNPDDSFITKEYILKNPKLLLENTNPLIHYFKNKE